MIQYYLFYFCIDPLSVALVYAADMSPRNPKQKSLNAIKYNAGYCIFHQRIYMEHIQAYITLYSPETLTILSVFFYSKNIYYLRMPMGRATQSKYSSLPYLIETEFSFLFS